MQCLSRPAAAAATAVLLSVECAQSSQHSASPWALAAVFRPQGFDASGLPQSPVLIATGRVPVFAAGQNASTGPITACPWAPGGAMQAGSTLLVNYVARDKYGRQDGPCPGRAAGSGPQVCTALATTAGG